MNTAPMDVVSLAHAAKNKRTRQDAGLEQFDEEEVSPAELAEEVYEFPDIEVPTPDEDRKRRVLTYQLKEHKIKHPDIDTRKTEQIDRELALLSTEELERRLENVQIELGIANPGQNAKSAIGIIGFLLEYYLGLAGITPKLVADGELIACIDAYLPASFHWLGVPFLFCFRLGDHVSKHINVNNRYPTPTIQPSPIPAQQGHPGLQAPAQPSQPVPHPTSNSNGSYPPQQQQLQQPPIIHPQPGSPGNPNNGRTPHPPIQGPPNHGGAVPTLPPNQHPTQG
jgi:hypothetical protein